MGGDWCIMTSKLKATGDCSSHHLQGAGAYCVGLTTGRTAYFQDY